MAGGKTRVANVGNQTCFILFCMSLSFILNQYWDHRTQVTNCAQILLSRETTDPDRDQFNQ
jgi:hypothetical protein